MERQSVRTYREFSHRGAQYRIHSSRFLAVTEEIVRLRKALETYITHHPKFGTSFEPVNDDPDAPPVARRMMRAARLTGVGPMAAVAGAMAQAATEAAIAAGADETIVGNGGDIYLAAKEPVVIGLYTGLEALDDRLAFAIPPESTPLAVCSSSGKMGHSTSLGDCDLATVVARDAALADAAATRAANRIRTVDDLNATLEEIVAIAGVDGLLLVKDDRVGLAGQLPELVRRRRG